MTLGWASYYSDHHRTCCLLLFSHQVVLDSSRPQAWQHPVLHHLREFAQVSSLGIVNYYKVSWGISPFLCILQREMELLDPNIQSTLNHPIHFQLCYPHDLCLQHWWLMRNAGQALAIWAYDVSPSPFSLLFWGKVPLNFCLVLHEQAVES